MIKRSLVVPLLFLVVACATQPATAPAPASAPAVANAVAPCNSGLAIVNATAWMQTAAEYQASTLQAYGTARRMLDAALADPSWSAVGPASTLPPAIVLDLDETAIDNSAFEARMIRQGTTYTREGWKQWVGESGARAIPGAAEFLQYAKSHGVTPFYITNRDADEKPATRTNLEKLGFPLSASEETLLTRGERPEWKTSDKTVRREFVASTHRVLLLLGDDLNDFTLAAGKSREERDAIVRAHAADFGQRWIILPNAIYGSWERAATGNTQGLSDCAQMQKRVDALDERRPSGAPATPMTSSSPTSDLSKVIGLALNEVEQGSPFTLIAGQDLPSAARDAASSLRKVIALASTTEEQRALPAGYARLDEALIEGNTATVRIWTGPIPKPRPGLALLACGTGRTFVLVKNANGAWEIKSRSVAMC